MDILALFDAEQITRWLETWRYILLFGMLFSCGLGVPIPEDIPLIAAGYFVSQGKMDLALAGMLAWAGIIGGDCMLYSIARRYGRNITKVPFIGKHVTEERLVKVEHLFAKYGVWVVAIGRLFAGIRGAMVVVAGTTRYNFIKFLIADGLAALVSGGFFVFLGWYGGKKLGTPAEIVAKAGKYQTWVFLGFAVAITVVILYFWWKHKRHKTLSQAALEKIEQKVTEHERSGEKQETAL